MITTSNLNKYSYARRISGLAIMIVSFIFIGISSQKIEAQTIEKKIIKQPKDTLIIVNKKAGDGKKIMIDKRVKDNGKKEIIIEKIVDGKEDETIEKEEDIFNVDPSKAPLYIIDGKETDAATLKNFDQKLITTVDVLKGDRVVQEYGDKAKNGVVKISTAKGDNGGKQNVIIKKMLPSAALIYVDGKQISQDEMNQIKPNDIESINVLKGESAIKKYGNKATEGVIEIIMKKAV